MLIQRVSTASVTVAGEVVGAIGQGLVVFLGVGREDTEAHAEYMGEKLLNLRIFEDAGGKMNLSVQEVGGGLLVISQFTLYGDIRKGRRPSFDGAAAPERAKFLYDYFVNFVKSRQDKVATGIFQAHMDVSLVNDGPVTIFQDSIDKFANKSHADR
jgi:D-tyrosyl-tRNA(Tyr) deacylase